MIKNHSQEQGKNRERWESYELFKKELINNLAATKELKERQYCAQEDLNCKVNEFRLEMDSYGS